MGVAGNGRKAAKPRKPVVPDIGGGFESVVPLDGLPQDWEFEELEPIGPDLPDASTLNLIDGVWSPFARMVYEHFRRTPQARQLRTQWEWDMFIYKMAVLDKSLKKQSYDGLAPEMRQSMNQYGDTPEAKRKLKFDVPEADDMAAGVIGYRPHNDFDDYKRRKAGIA